MKKSSVTPEKITTEEFNKLSPEEKEKLVRKEIAALSPEEAEARRREIIKFGQELRMQLGRSVLNANPGIFNKVH